MLRFRAMSETIATVNDWMESNEEVSALAHRLRICADVLEGKVRPEDPCNARVQRREEREMEAIKLLPSQGGVTSGRLARVLRCSDETARQTLQRLAERQIAKALGHNKGRRYIPGRAYPRATPSLE